jgi:Ca2+-binding EF-hand superfamily protein
MSQSGLDLSIREKILQVLKSRAQNGASVIHSSDFRNAITELGYPMGSTLIENILVYCKLDKSGNIDFSQLENRLSHERKVFNSYQSTQQSPINNNVSESNAASNDLEYQYKAESDKQLARVTENSAFVTSIYNQLSDHTISREQAYELLQSVDIHPTKEFQKLSQKIEINHVPYSEFIFSLTKSSYQPSIGHNVAAGGYKVKPEPTGESIGSFRKRSSDKHPSLNCTANKIILQHKSGHDVFQDELIPQPKPMRKMLLSLDGTNQNVFHASQVKEVLFGNKCTSNAEIGESQLFSSAQQSLIDGAHGRRIQATFNIEQKLQREQIWAALRKLDTNQISFFDFQDLINSMGITIPENILIEIKRSYHAGHVDVRKFIKLLDAAIFKVSAVDEFIESSKKINELRKKFKREIIESAAITPDPKIPFKKITNFNVLNELYVVFYAMDKDQNGLLTYTEFKNVCDEFNHRLGISDEDLKILFHSLDHNGDIR